MPNVTNRADAKIPNRDPGDGMIYYRLIDVDGVMSMRNGRCYSWKTWLVLTQPVPYGRWPWSKVQHPQSLHEQAQSV